MAKRLTIAQRRAVFHDLVALQDEIHDVRRSREQISKKHGISESQLRQIEDEGIDRQWPPLEEEEETVSAAGGAV